MRKASNFNKSDSHDDLRRRQKQERLANERLQEMFGALQQGDDSAWRELFHGVDRDIVQYIDRYFTSLRNDAEDILIETLLKLKCDLPTRTYLTRQYIFNAVGMACRKHLRLRYHQSPSVSLDQSALNQLSDTYGGSDDDVPFKVVLGQEIWTAMETLEQPKPTVLRLTFEQGLNDSEIAEILAMCRTSVARIRASALMDLQRRFRAD